MIFVGLNVVNFELPGDARTVGDAVVRAEASGFDLAMVSDHVAVTPDVNQSYPAPSLEGTYSEIPSCDLQNGLGTRDQPGAVRMLR